MKWGWEGAGALAAETGGRAGFGVYEHAGCVWSWGGLGFVGYNRKGGHYARA